MRTRAWVVVGSLAVGGCGLPPPPWGLDGGTADAGVETDVCLGTSSMPPWADLGVGQSAYHPLADGESVAWEAGPQGGHHIWVSMRVRGVLQMSTLTTFSATDVTATPALPLVRRTVPFVLDQDEGGACVLKGIRLQLDEDPAVNIQELEGHRLRVEVEATDDQGHTARSQHEWVLSGPRP